MPIIDPYVSSTTARVFALRGLDEEVCASLFAAYSRANEPLRDVLSRLLESGDLVGSPTRESVGRTLRAELLRGNGSSALPIELNLRLEAALDAIFPDAASPAVQRAAAFHQKWTVGYGHGSVAEHAKVAVGVERCSILAAKALEEASYGVAFTEQSTRYVDFGRASYVKDIGIPAERVDLQTRYEAATEGLLAVYAEATAALSAYAESRWPEATAAQRRGWVLDITRAILPCAATTRLGMTLNGRAARHMVRKHRVSALPELRELAAELDVAARSVLPTLASQATPEPGRAARESGREYMAQGVQHRRFLCTIQGAENIRRHIRDDLTIAASAATVRRYMESRGPTERPGRAFEMIPVEFAVELDYGAWRDVQRHRPFSMPPVVLSPWSAWHFPNAGDLSRDLRARVEAAVETAQAVGQSLFVEGLPALAAYPLPLGTLVHAEVHTNLRAVLQFIELRSRVSGHDSYRAVAWMLCDAVNRELPELAPYIRCDRSARTFART